MTPGLLSTTIPLALVFVPGAWAQTDVAECKPGWDWNLNSLGQDPCRIGSMLDASCRSIATYTYPPLNGSHQYLPPKGDDTADLICDCNTVMYSLYMACSTCQGGQIYSWTKWVAACNKPTISKYPANIPPGTAVPRWAFFNVMTLPMQMYSDANAIRIGRDPEELPSPAGTDTLSVTTPTLDPRSTTGIPKPTDISRSGSKTRMNVGAMVGGISSCVVLLVILAIVAFLCVRRRKRKSAEQLRPQSTELELYGLHRPSVYGSLVTDPQYNPSDPSTSPLQSPLDSVTYIAPSYSVHRNYTDNPEDPS